MDLPTSDIHKQAVKSLDTTSLLTNAARQRDARNYDSFPDPVLKQMGMLYTGGGTGGQSPLNPGGVGYQDVSGRVTR